MTIGDIIRTPTGRLARYQGGSLHGAVFVYLDERGKVMRFHGEPDGFVVASTSLLAKLQSEVVARV